MDIGVITSIELNHKTIDFAKKGQEVCIKIEPIPGEAPKMYGRHFEATDIIVSKVRMQRKVLQFYRVLPSVQIFHMKNPVMVMFQITRASIDALKNWFRDEMQKTDWQLIVELKKTFEII